MNRYLKYILFIIISFASVGLFYATSSEVNPSILHTMQDIKDTPYNDDTLPRFPVKQTQASTYEDLSKTHPIDLKDPSNVVTSVHYDPYSKLYVITTRIGDDVISTPISLNSDEYLNYTLKKSMSEYFKNQNKLDKDGKKNDGEFSLKDIKLNMNPSDKLFGPGGVKLKATGYVEATMGVKYTSIDNPSISPRNRKKTAFEFKEDIQVNVSASVGDRINFDMNYDTKPMFDFDAKKINLGYTGEEDEIIKYIGAGNVSMKTTNSLINGGTALFGINTELQFGKLKVNAVISQQESEARSVNSQGGVQTQTFEFKADQYDENRHFFLGHYFHDNYDRAMSKFPYIQSPINITRIEVWVTNSNRTDNQSSRNMIAFAELAEAKGIQNPNWIANPAANTPNNAANSLYSSLITTYAMARDKNQITTTLAPVMQDRIDYDKIENARLLDPSEYSLSPQLGYISLNSALQTDQVLAVAYEYKLDGKDMKVGEFASDILAKYVPGNPRSGALFLKMLKPVSLSPDSYTWKMMMKNVYSVGATGIQKDKFRLNISYQSDTLGTYINYIPEGNIQNQLLLRVLNLDRLDSREKTNPDGIFDYVEDYTVRSENGRIYFPVVEPFGSHLEKKIGNAAIAKKYVYSELYNSSKTAAQQIAEKNKFKIYGSYKGSANNADINLNATNVPQGSVRITAGGRTLTEGVDYIIDYMSGFVTILDPNIVDSNTPVSVSLEDRTFSTQRKTMLGMNLSYDINKNISVGGTLMHYYEKPITTKVEMGSEAAKNTLWGLNASFKKESQWLTNLVDKMPFVNATVPSQISVDAEFAHLIAGHYKNNEAGAYSYLDDFESSQSRIDLKAPYAWNLAATPADPSAGALFPEANKSNDIIYGKNRAMLSWFMIDGLFTRKNSSLTPQHIKNDKEQLSNHFVREVYVREIYPNRDVAFNEAATLPVLNLSYYPTERGPYNLDDTNIAPNGELLNPDKRWGGITRRMDVRDFETSNVEYIEFWLMDPFVYNSTASVPNMGGDLYFNLGEISEDVLKDGKKFYENGLPLDNDPSAYETTVWGKVPTRQAIVYAFDDKLGNEGRKKQDVGLNGLSTEEEFSFGTYANYLTNYTARLSGTALSQQQNDPFSPLKDPAGDTYRFYRDNYYDRNEIGVLDRYKRINGTEGNSPANDTNAKYSTAARTVPDVEDLNQDYTLNETESYYQYKVNLRPAQMVVGTNNIVDSREVTVPLRNGTEGKITWYQFKIPIREGTKVGNIQGYKSIRFMRMFLTKFDQTTFLRFGTLQLVRGDWRVYEQTLNKNNDPSGTGTMDIATVNVEENGDRKPVNYILPPGLSRVLDPDQTQLSQENEQSLSMRVQNLASGDARAIYKNTNYDLRRYKRLQLFTHAEELIDGTSLAPGEITVFLRLGSDYKNNYYEYEIPLSITPHGVYNQKNNQHREIVWPNNNMFDFPLAVLKDLKLQRNKEKRKAGSTIKYTDVFTGYDPHNRVNKISVIGNPSLSDVNVIMVGVRNNSRQDKSGEVWINELRLSDFDEKGGWAAQGTVNLALSDIGTINLSGRTETAGFGALDQSLMERRQDDFDAYTISTTLDLGRFLPEKAKLSLPFYYSYSSEKTTPEYDPFDQDVTLKESLSIVGSRQERDSIKSLAIDKTRNKSISFNNVKLNIQSKTPMPWDPANFSLGYNFNETQIKNPTTVYDVSKNYKAQLGYSYSPLVKTWDPFKNKKGNKGANKYLKSLAFNYLPSNIGFNSTITRFYTETMLRDIEGYSVGGQNQNTTFLSWSQDFYWDRDFSIDWNFTRNLKLSFQSGTRAEIEEPYRQVNKQVNRADYEIWRDSVWRSILQLGNPLEYRQTAKISYQLPFRNIPIMDWINSNVSYSSGYEWNRGARIEDVEIGNTIRNQMTIDFNNKFNLTSLYNKSTYLKKVNDRFDNRRKQKSLRERTKEEQEKKKRSKPYRQTVMLSPTQKQKIAHILGSKDLDITAKKDGKPYKIKYKKLDENTIEISNKDSGNIEIVILAKEKEPGNDIWKDVAEYSLRGLMSARNISVNYSRRNETNIDGYKPRVGNAFGQRDSEFGLAPGLGFAFGLDGGEDFVEKALQRDWLIMNTENIIPAVYNTTEKLEVRMQLEPFKGMKIDLNAAREKTNRTDLYYMQPGMPRTLGGSFSMTTVALATSLRGSNAKNNYHSAAFEKFLTNRDAIKDRLEGKYKTQRYPSGGFMDDNLALVGHLYTATNGDVGLNSSDVLIPAFIAAYTGKGANSVSLSPFPSLLALLPNWKISYDGLSKIPMIKTYFNNIRFDHRYSCFYQVGSYTSYSDWMGTEDNLGFIRDVLNGNPVPSSPYNISSVSITESFNPLFGAEAVLKNNVSFNSQYNTSRNINLNTTAYQIIESIQQEVIVGMGYRIDEFNRLVGLTDRNAQGFNNDLSIKADVSYKMNQALIRKIEEHFTQATSGTSVTTIRFSADYTMTKHLTLRAFFDRMINKPLITSNGYPSSNNNFGLSIKFMLSQ